MQFVKRYRKALLALIICLVCATAVLIPFLMRADVDTFNWTWVEHSFDGNHCEGVEKHTDHLVIEQNGAQSTIDFYGHRSKSYFEYSLTSPGNPGVIQNEFFNFTINTAEQYPHSCDGSGFMFNVNQENNTGYYLMIEEDHVYLMYLNGFEDPSTSTYGLYNKQNMTKEKWSCGHKTGYGKIAPYDPYANYAHYHNQTSNGEYITGGDRIDGCTIYYEGPHELLDSVFLAWGSTLHNISIQATADHLVYIDNDKVLLDVDLPYNTGGCDFGPAVQWAPHNCDEESHVQFKNVLCGVNKYPPVADFNYNLSVADIRQPVIVTYTARDRNTPATSLTYFWDVERVETNGTLTKVYSGSTAPSNYGKWGAGTYKTSLRVKNEYYLFSNTVSKMVQIIQNPSINIAPEKSEYYAGENITFKCNRWYNCATEARDVVIENIVSDNLYDPSVFLVGSDGISLTSGELSAEVVFKYKDETSASQTVTISRNGLTVSDPDNTGKKVSKIIITYKSLPKLAEIKPDSYVLYTYKTTKELSDYYSGGVSPRRYEISNAVTCNIQIATGPISANGSATANLVEKTVSFSLSGEVDNNNAITNPPECNTEFLLTGTTVGGETLSRYIVVTEGKSPSITVPYGNYVISEDPNFSIGYDDISPMSIKISDDGIIVDEKTVIENNGEIPFVKVLQVAKININRICESETGIAINSDTDFKVTLSGTPVVDEITASFELVSPMDDLAYYWDGKSDIILPIGTYAVDETQFYRLVSLKNITANEDYLWDRTLNTKANMKGKAAFIAEKDKELSVILRYVSDEYVYDEYVYENEIYFDVSPVNDKGAALSDFNIDGVLLNPAEHRYPITLVNSATGEEYSGIIKPGTGVSFKYMTPGKYSIICRNNMYMDFDKLKEMNSDNVEFLNQNDQYYLVIPDDYSFGEYNETSNLCAWRGYSDLSTSLTNIQPQTKTHVSLTVNAIDQEKVSVAGCGFQFFNGDEPMYFVFKNQKWYPATKEIAGAVSSFQTDENGEFEIYKFPEGEYTIKVAPPNDDLYAITPIQTFIVDGTRNIGIKTQFAEKSKAEAPSLISINTLKRSIAIGESLQIASSITPVTASKDVSYASADNNVASVSDDGIVTGNGVGTTIIKVISDKDSSVIGEIEISVYDSQNPKMANLKHTISNIKLETGESYAATVTYTPVSVVSPNITWSSSNPSVASVSANGTITAGAVGVADITAECGGLTAVCRVTVGKTLIPVREITFKEDAVTLIYNNNKLSQGKVEVAVSPDDASDPTVTFTSSDSTIVSVDSDGNLTAKEAGTVVITATSTNGVSQSCVVSSVPIVDNITLNVNSFSIIKGNTTQVMAHVSPEGTCNEDSLKWESLDPTIASVDEAGVITANEVGETIIVLTTSYPGAPDVTTECIVNVVTDEIMATGVSFYLDGELEAQPITEDIEMAIGEELEFIGEVVPSTTTNAEIEWSYSRANVVTVGPVDESNTNSVYNRYRIVANGDSGGETTVTGRVKGTNVTASFKVIVESPGTGFSFTKHGTQTLVLDADPLLNIGVEFDNLLSSAKDIKWSLSDETKATLSISDNKRDVTVTATEAGTVTLTAEVEFRVGGTYTESIDINIEEPRIDILVNNAPVNAVSINKGETQVFIFQPNCPKESFGPLTCTFENYDENIIKIKSVPEYNTDKGWAYTITGLASGSTTFTVQTTNNLFSPQDITVNVSEEQENNVLP